MTTQDRATKVAEAVSNLPSALADALKDQDNTEAWEHVEKLGAIVHRQSRLLAGKSKGG